MEHKLYGPGDYGDAPELVREGGLSMCRVCGGAEGAMPTHCPGVPMGAALADAVFHNRIDYVDGKWVGKAPVDVPGDVVAATKFAALDGTLHDTVEQARGRNKRNDALKHLNNTPGVWPDSDFEVIVDALLKRYTLEVRG